MRKIFAVFALLAAVAFAAPSVVRANDYGAKIQSSYSDVANLVPVMIASAPISLVAIMVSSPAAGGNITIYRSTSATFTTDITTMVTVNCDYNIASLGVMDIPFFDIESSSYTYMIKNGACKTTVLFRWIAPELMDEGRAKVFGLKQSGQKF